MKKQNDIHEVIEESRRQGTEGRGVYEERKAWRPKAAGKDGLQSRRRPWRDSQECSCPMKMVLLGRLEEEGEG